MLLDRLEKPGRVNTGMTLDSDLIEWMDDIIRSNPKIKSRADIVNLLLHYCRDNNILEKD